MNRNYEEFKELLVNRVKEHFASDTWVTIEKTKNVNRPVCDALLIKPRGEMISPVIYLKDYYDEWDCGQSIEEIAADILALYGEYQTHTHEFDLEAFYDYKKVEKRLFCRLVNYENNREQLKEVPHIRFHDLALVYFYAPEGATDFQNTITIRDYFLQVWDITREQLHQAALQNTRCGMDFQFTTVSSAIEELISMKPEASEKSEDSDAMGLSEAISRMDENREPSMYVLTNRQMMYGAVGVYFDEVLRMVSSRLQKDFYVLPSSIHECLVIPGDAFDEPGAEQLKGIVQSINAEYVDPVDILGDCVYRYDCSEEKLSIAA